MDKAFQFTWSSQQFNLKDFVECYKAQLPQIVKVTQGYYGYGDHKYTYSTEEIFRITSVNTQQRVIARDISQRLLSIPAEYPIKFHVIEKRKEIKFKLPATTLKVFFKFNQFQPGIKVIPENRTHLTFWVGAEKTVKTDIGTLELVDTYKDLYLVGNVITSTGVIQSRTIHIPLFIDIKVVLANGIRYQNEEYFRSVLKHYCDSTENFTTSIMKGNPEIMLLDESQKKVLRSSSDYIYMEPKTYISCAQVDALRRSPTETTSTNPITMNKDTTPKQVIPTSCSRKQTQKIDKPLPPPPEWPKNTTPSTNSTGSGNEKMMQMKVAMPSHISLGSEYLIPNTDLMKTQNPDATSSNPFVTEWGNDEIQPYMTTYCKFTPIPISSENKYFSNFNEVPLSLNGVSKKGIADCLNLLHLDSYVQLFNDNDIDGTLLTSMDKDSLMDIGLSNFEAHKLYQFKNGWRPKD